MIFYTYLWLREDGTPYYVGKGCKRRAFEKHYLGHSRCLLPPTPNRVLTQEWADEEQAFEAEKFLIAYYGRKDNNTGILCNRTDGGCGNGNTRPTLGKHWKLSEQVRVHLSTAQVAAWLNKETRENRTSSIKKLYERSEARAITAAATKLALSTPAVRARISAAQKIAKNKPTARRSTAEQVRARWANPEYKARVSAALRKPHGK